MKKSVKLISLVLAIVILLCACQSKSSDDIDELVTVSNNCRGIIDEKNMFTSRDLDFSYDNETAEKIILNDGKSLCNSKNVKIDKNTITIKNGGVYIISGKLSNGQIVVSADDSDKVQLILDGVNINCDTSCAIYGKKADKLFVTLKGQSYLSNKKDFVQTDKNKINAVLYSKCDLTLNGDGALDINAAYGRGVTSKDDLVITSGTYNINAQKHSIYAKDSIRIADGKLNLTCGKNGIYCKNNKNEDKGFIYINGGSITINADNDGIKSKSAILLAGGTIDILKSKEGIEARFVEIADGNIKINSDDDGINASYSDGESNNKDEKNKPQLPDNLGSEMPQPPADMPQDFPQGELPEMPQDMPQGKPQGDMQMPFGNTDDSVDCSITISGGKLTVNANGDGIDSNGIITVTGGETIISGAESNGDCAFDYGTQATISGGKLIATGMSGMAQGFSNASTQGSILFNTESICNAGTTVKLDSSSGNTLFEAAPQKSFNSVLISTPEMKTGEKLYLSIGDTTEKIKLSTICYSNGGGMFPDKNFPDKQKRKTNK